MLAGINRNRAVELEHGERDGMADVNMGMNPTAKEE